ncbi:MAG: hypothetical protein JST50_14120 [Bacteroidetes bacterium]|jgi:hypothetical protein|nr:hypothetical protein [Bacteroidota bacterium]
MGKQLESYNGAVLFVDILGFGALTNNLIKLTDKDFEAWTDGTEEQKNNQFLAANLLVAFREILQLLEHEFADVKIAQLSDCFFAWSRSIEKIVLFTHKYMHMAIERGILCRGGMAYGEIIETERIHHLGRLILGKAVTTAVGLEKPAKGMRILFDTELHAALHNENKKFMNCVSELFCLFENPLDYKVYDEFKWYGVKDLSMISEHGIHNCSADLKIGFAKDRLKLVNRLVYHPRFGWNSRSGEGMVHLQATNNFISQDGLYDVKHEFERVGFSDSRSVSKVTSADVRIENDKYVVLLRKREQ